MLTVFIIIFIIIIFNAFCRYYVFIFFVFANTNKFSFNFAFRITLNSSEGRGKHRKLANPFSVNYLVFIFINNYLIINQLIKKDEFIVTVDFSNFQKRNLFLPPIMFLREDGIVGNTHNLKKFV